MNVEDLLLSHIDSLELRIVYLKGKVERLKAELEEIKRKKPEKTPADERSAEDEGAS